MKFADGANKKKAQARQWIDRPNNNQGYNNRVSPLKCLLILLSDLYVVIHSRFCINLISDVTAVPRVTDE